MKRLRRVMRCADCGRRAVKEPLSRYPIFQGSFAERVKVWTHADDFTVHWPDDRPHAYVGRMRVRFVDWEWK